ncbi:MAG: hypothetical protein HY015_00065 [Bacteroidetes bacterium]|nr:hypothetical protein [Bacteroidota bacterium]
MKNFTVTVLFMSIASFYLKAQKNDTLVIRPEHLGIKDLTIGRSTYIIYSKKSKESPAERTVLVKINVESIAHNGKPAISVTQQWDRDTITHAAVTLFNRTDFSTISHNSFWKRLGYTSKFDFETKKVSFEGKVIDSIKNKITSDFNDSFKKYNLNWHSDLVIFSLLPYKENRVFKINFYDPGFGKAQEVFYSVTGSDFLSGSSGEKIDCWTLINKITTPVNGYQKFWISKKTKEVLKEEDSFNGQYRYKLKFAVSEEY